MSRYAGLNRAAVVLLVALAAGCVEQQATEPVRQYEVVEGVAADVSWVATYRTGTPTSSVSASQWIGPEGGTLRLLDFEVVVPPGAVSTLTKFRIKLPADPKRLNRALAEFEPHNVPFAQPVTLRMPYRGTSAEGETSNVIWWNGARWIRYATTLLPDGRLETMTDHFSEFGTEDLDERGITPVGG